MAIQALLEDEAWRYLEKIGRWLSSHRADGTFIQRFSRQTMPGKRIIIGIEQLQGHCLASHLANITLDTIPGLGDAVEAMVIKRVQVHFERLGFHQVG